MLQVYPTCLVVPPERISEVVKRHKDLEHDAGDHFTLLNIFNQFVNRKLHTL